MKRVTMFAVAALLLGVQAQHAQATVACCRLFANGAINGNGSFRCNFSGAETRRLAVGTYEVDFTPASNDVRFYAKSATLDTNTGGSTSGEIGIADRAGDVSSVFVTTRTSAGALADRAFDVCLE
ncbi:MAG TPA: hypothetical protein VKJ47_04305 [Candidatus Binatia bacterium]|nr:hypothetical protein [Candidatus Binatia bacterium]